MFSMRLDIVWGAVMRVKTEAKRQHIVDVAAQAFRELGFEGASMAEICARVGGSKATLYNYFASKEELLFEVMRQSCEVDFDAAYRAIDVTTDDIGKALQKFGERFLAALYSPEVQANRHLAITSSSKTDLGRLMYERGVRQSQAVVTEVLSAAMKQGKLRPADPGKITSKEIRAITARAIAVFMAAYRPA